ncbi:hypothetical protein MBLNU457_5708t1 [Dothideomycetes sp. NU457]
MLDIGHDKRPDASKCYYSSCALPQYIDDKQPPAKRKPFSTVLEHPFNHSLDIIIRNDVYQKHQEQILQSHGKPQYAKVHMKLKDIIEGDFFNKYIRTGDILMLSEGRPGLDNTYSLRDGILRLELDKPTYERAGLFGKPIESHDRKHTKSRYAIDLNLRLPSMVRGRPLFNRMVYAFENALVDTFTWLFYDPEQPSLNTNDSSPVKQYAPFIYDLSPDVHEMKGVTTPHFPNDFTDEDSIEAVELLEWIQLAMLDSPRLRQNDNIDAYLCRYQVPDLLHIGKSIPDDSKIIGDSGGEANKQPNAAESSAEAVDLVRLSWRGFIPCKLITEVTTNLLKVLVPEDWFALRNESFDGKSYTMLKRNGNVMLWECE